MFLRYLFCTEYIHQNSLILIVSNGDLLIRRQKIIVNQEAPLGTIKTKPDGLINILVHNDANRDLWSLTINL